ncbi:protease HtpX [Silanimonas sp.]|jgi:heat shock protein HtpX|uniref:protease HtpX n=1 Tax=Silanimonas sp. TaxID=1929290 RepID=UPI0022C681D8|nr:protease HtpX [Silanimonas sp.]MCZ8115074.1 protease HtpX [Silanimonas sp.]
MKRIALFLATNLAVLLVFSVVWMILSTFFGLSTFAANNNVNYTGMLVFCAIFGFGGAFVSLLMSKWMAKRSTGMRVIDQPRNEIEQWLYSTVKRQAEKAGIGMPEVGIYDAPEINAFATGASRNNSLVAVSTGLLRAMSRDEAEAVLAHEVSHVANGDMVTLTLIQGVVNTFVMFLARIIGNIIDRVVFKNEDGPGIGYFVTVMVLEIIFGILASTIVMAFSRWREFRADAGGADLAGREKMIAALERLAHSYGQSTLPSEVRAFGISGGVAGGFKKLFMSHPPLAERIQALREYTPRRLPTVA